MNLLTLSPASTKDASSKTLRATRRVFSWPDVLRAIAECGEARTLALAHYRASGFTPDDFAHSRAARECMADALTRAEDWLEMHRPRFDRGVIQAVRRSLEGDQ